MDLTLGLLFLLPGFILAGNEANLGGGDNSQISDNMPFVFTSILFAPYLIQNPDSSAEGNDRYIGFIADLVKELATRLDFKYELKLVDDGKWGSRDSTTGKWNGMIGEVISGKADSAAAPLVISRIRKLVVDFTDPFMDTNLAVLIHKDSGITSVEELVLSNYSYGTLDSGWNKAIIMSARSKPYAQMWARMTSSEPSWFVRDNEEGVIRALNEQYGYILRKPMADFFARKDCRLKVVSTILGNDGYGIALPRQSRKLGEFNAMLRRMKEDGFIDEIKWKWWMPEPCPYPQYAHAPAVCGSSIIVICIAHIVIHLIRL